MRGAHELEHWMLRRVADRLGLAPHEVGTDTPLADFGFSSTDAVAFSGDLEKHCGIAIPPTLFWEHPTIGAIARHLTGTGHQDETRATQDFEPIAVIGMGCRFPGGADSPAGLWRLLVEGRDAVREGPHDRWDVEAFYDPDSGTAGRSTSKQAAYLDDVAGFDAAFFGIPAREAAAMDPQHRLLLEVSWEALEHAGLPPRGMERTRTGVFAGLCYVDYAQRVVGRYTDIDAYVGTGNAHSTAVGRISYLLGLNGPSVAIDTACSSSLVAIHLACQSLRLGESDLAVAGGASLLLRPEGMIIGSRWGMLSAAGRCHSFDARADGFVRGEGAGAVVLKRLADAERDGDRVLAVVRGSAVNQDGRSQGLTAPSVSAQRAVLAEAVQLSGVDPADVEMVESHGTGTPLGDPIEFAALAEVYGAGKSRCALGAVKSNLGHTEAAAGVAGFIKTVLALRHGVVPPNLHFESWNPEIPAQDNRFFVPTEEVPLTRGLAAVSSFGMSGTNAHVVLERAEPPAADRATDRVEVFTLSAGSEAVLPEAAARLAGWVRTDGARVPLNDVAATLACRRSHAGARTAVVARTREELLAGLANPVTGTVVAGAARGPVWVFSGQGSQWAGMGTGLLAADPAFRMAVDEVEPLIERESGFSVRETLASPDVVTGIDRVQPTLFAMQVALAAAWRARGVEPAAVIGHSMGEIAAAVVAGALSVEDGVRVVCRRSRLMVRLSGAGAMASVDLSRAEVERELTPGVTVAVVASPRSTVVAGATDEVELLVARWQERGLVARLVAVDVASHSPQVDPILAELAERLADLTPQQAEIRWYSTVRDEAVCDSRYWVDNLRRPVRLAEAVTAAQDDGHSVFVEISPHPVLAHALAETLGDDAVVLHTLKRDQDEEETVAGQLAALYRAGCPVRWTTRGRLADLPTTTWDRKRHWIDLPLPHPDQEFAAAGTAHPLLGEHVEVPGGEHVWRADLGTRRLPWLTDHQVDGLAVLPGAGFCEIAVAAAAEYFGAEPHEVEVTDLTLDRFLAIAERGEVSTVVRAVDRDRARCEVLSRSGDEWVRHATAQLRRNSEPKQPPAVETAVLSAGLSERLNPEDFYAALRSAGYFHGPAFAGVQELSRAGDTVFAKVRAPRSWPRRFHLHPALLDSCLQALAAAPLADTADEARLTPSGFGGVRIFGDPRRTEYCRAQLEADGDEVTGQVALLDADGTVLASVDNIRLLRFEPPVDVAPLLHEISWEPVPLGDAPADPASWRVVGDGDLADRVRERLGEDEDASQVVLIAGDGDGRDEVMRFLDVLTAQADRVRVVTRGGLEQSALRGITRVAMFEHTDLRPALVELDPALTDLDQLADQLVAELLAGRDEDEVSWRDGERRVARLVPAQLERPQRTVRYGRDGFALDIARYGDLDALGIVVRPRREPGAGEVEIQVLAAGMNFRDVYIAMGFYPVAGALLGSDCAGVVSAIGPDVTGLAVGDRVMTLADGAFGSFVTVGADRVLRIPPGTSVAEAATMPAAYLTAWHALRDVARLAPGERVLIHSASGGVGLAAIAVARACGAEVLATAGNAHKREYLRGLGIEHVMDSRTLDFVEQTRQATGGAGVDVVLNSLSGPALAAGLDVLAIGGRFVEIGKRDIYADTKLGLSPFRRNISMCSVDLDLLLRNKKELSLRLLGEVAAEIHAGRLTPLPHQEIELEDAVTAFRTMAAAKHIGRIVLTLPRQGETTAVVPVGPVVRADGAYVITGGLGGLGTEMARWLTARGAGRVVLNSRTARSAEFPVVAGDIASPGVAEELVAVATEGGLPLRGIIHAAGVLGDGLLDGLGEERLTQVWRPKVDGAKRLHEASTGHDLDWFVLFSSAAALFGNPGQGAYAAANSWLDGFAAWRRDQGLPALSVNWGVWAARGMAEVVAGRGYRTFSVREGVAALETLLDHEVTRAGVFPFDTDGLLSVLPTAAESSFFAAMPVHRESCQSGTVAAELAAVDPARRTATMVAHLAERIAAILGTGVIDPDQPLAHLGIDSLTALQLRNRLESDLAVPIPATAVWAHPSITALAAYLLDRMDLGSVAPPAEPEAAGVVLRYVTRERARTRLYCFPYMGGSASAYRSWASECPPTVELCVLQPPGRENRADEPFASDVRALADSFADAVLAESDERPFAFFGHSGGAVLAFETARALRRRGAPAPVLLGVSSMLAPHDPRWASRVRAALGDASSDAILRMGAVPREVLDDPNLTALVEPVIRADVALYANYECAAESPLDCPIRTFSGEQDPIYAPDELTTWRELTTADVTSHSYPGGHFYFRDQIAHLVNDICADL